MLRKIILLHIALVGGMLTSCGQVLDFSQHYTNLLNSNPAFAGTYGCHRLYANYRNQLNNIAKSYVSYYLSYDKNIKKPNIDIGALLSRDEQGGGVFRNTYGGLILAKQFRVNKGLQFKLAAEVGYFQYKLSTENSSFADMIHPYYGFIYYSTEPLETYSEGHLNIKGAFLMYSSTFFAGATLKNLNAPRNKQTENEKLMQRGLQVILGKEFIIKNQFSKLKGLSVFPTFFYDYQNLTNAFSVGMYTSYWKLIAGCWIRNTLSYNAESFVYMLGFVEKNFKFAYSCDYATLKGDFFRFNTHELSITFYPKCSEKNNKIRAIKCPGM